MVGTMVYNQHPLNALKRAMNPVVRGDIRVSEFLDSVGGFRYKDRRNILLDILDVDLDWRMHQISDGERRRVQLVMGLMVPWTLLLLDEVTVDLDVVVRSDLINFLITESKERNATILCEQLRRHSYLYVYPLQPVYLIVPLVDGLIDFPTHVLHLRLGSNIGNPEKWPLEEGSKLHEIIKSSSIEASPLLKLALGWLREDLIYRREYEKSIDRRRGAREETTDSEVFYSKFDYTPPDLKKHSGSKLYIFVLQQHLIANK
ncbi:P-loop containing nucleoside triphosphate hydrolase protein [Wallemia mellicola]|nr:P-loop containing nucleoside triphosphate hydrolase protein [Wallemia mellicola]